jgi:hypothetical protein
VEIKHFLEESESAIARDHAVSRKENMDEFGSL